MNPHNVDSMDTRSGSVDPSPKSPRDEIKHQTEDIPLVDLSVRPQEIKDNDEPKFRVANMDSDLLEQILSKCSTNPSGFMAGKQDNQLPNWKFWQDEDKNYHVVVPKDLESQADHWPHIVGICAANALRAIVHVSTTDSEDLGFTEAHNQYLHGLGSALKQYQIERQKVSGGYLQGYGWIISQTEIVQKHPEWFRTKYTSPLVFLTGKKVWNKAPDGDRGRWYNLILRAAREKTLANPVDHIIPFNERVKVFMKREFAFDKGSVFTLNERQAMRQSISHLLEPYQRYEEELKKPDIESILTFKTRLSLDTKLLRDYDTHIAAIATQRASHLYSPKMKKNLGKGAYLLEDRFDALAPDAFFECSNATGLLFRRKRVPLTIKDKNADNGTILYMIHGMLNKVDETDDLGIEWINWCIRLLKRRIAQESEEQDGI